MGRFQFGQPDVARHSQSVVGTPSPFIGFYPSLFLQIVSKEAYLAPLPVYG